MKILRHVSAHNQRDQVSNINIQHFLGTYRYESDMSEDEGDAGRFIYEAEQASCDAP
jgi:hypothetical protein